MTLDLPEEEICNKYISGLSTVDLAEEYNCSNETIGNRLRKNNIKLRDYSERNYQRLINDPTIKMRTSESLKRSHIDDPTIAKRISKGVIQAHINDPTIAKKMSKSTIQSYIDDPTYRERISKGVLKAHINDPTYKERISKGVLKVHIDDPTIAKRLSKSTIQSYIDDPTYKERLSKGAFRSHINDPTLSERSSARMQNQDYDAGEWTGFIDRDNRDYINDERNCIKLNKRFNGCHMHHIMSSIVIYIPSELHIHYFPHNIKTGLNMYEINMVAFQYINNGDI